MSDRDQIIGQCAHGRPTLVNLKNPCPLCARESEARRIRDARRSGLLRAVEIVEELGRRWTKDEVLMERVWIDRDDLLAALRAEIGGDK